MFIYSILLIMTGFGLIDSIYLIHKRKKEQKPICLIGGNCNTVLQSNYSNIFKIHNDILGLFYYCTLAGLISLMLINPDSFLFFLISLLIWAGVIYSLILTYLQWQVIKAWCTWCLVSAMTIVAMAVTLIINQLST
ncbi:vitamin K epoxide reductase family protein [Patescibacteria group bacterium]